MIYQLLNLLKKKDFSILFIGQFISKMGSSINAIGLSLYVLKFDNPILGMGTLSLLFAIPWIIFGPIAGVFADRYSKKQIIIACDITRGLLSIILFFTQDIVLFYSIVFLMTIFDVIFSPAISSFLPLVVNKDDLESANSIYSGSGELAYLIGPAIGGILVASLGVRVVFVLNSISYILSGISEMFIVSSGYINKDKHEKVSTFLEMKQGFIYAKSHNDIVFIILFFAGISAVLGGIPTLCSNYIVNELGTSEQVYGIFISIKSIGSMIGALLLPKVLSKIKELPVMIWSTGIYGGLYVLFSIWAGIPYYMIIYFSIGVITSFINVTYGIFLQKNVDKEYIGRVFSFDMSLSNFTMITSILFTTFAGNFLGTQNLIIIYATTIVAISLIGLLAMKNLKLDATYKL
ncbi:MAG: MFS transporter [Romboutsia sp.]|uniref:MFS transporter n=1 Tax=Romboutsia sp. TaxID=1965302 RepID=UPI003F2B47C8